MFLIGRDNLEMFSLLFVDAEDFRKVFEEGCQASDDKLTENRSSIEDAHSDKEDKTDDIGTLSNSVKECLNIASPDTNSSVHCSSIKTDA
uniref:Uncharacterized protein n=1 Tax=Schistosoma haematobium TaxID=6185 RepID=A0A095C2F6_SCHHA